mgnify:CR=1 FL=1
MRGIYNNMKFLNFRLFLENTVAQVLNNRNLIKNYNSENIKDLQQKMRSALIAASPVFFNGVGSKKINLIANFFLYNEIREPIEKFESSPSVFLIRQGIGKWREAADYIIANINNNSAMSKLNSLQYNFIDLFDDSHKWHEELKKKGGKQGATDGQTILEFPDGFHARLPSAAAMRSSVPAIEPAAIFIFTS